MTDLVFRHGDERYTKGGGTVQRSVLAGFGGELPVGMHAFYITTTSDDGSVKVEVTKQARSKHGRRYDIFHGETAIKEAQANILRWGRRILRERTAVSDEQRAAVQARLSEAV